MMGRKRSTPEPFPIDADIYRRVALLASAAQKMIATGIDDMPSNEFPDIVPGPDPSPMSEDQCARYVYAMSNAYALGIAVGLRLDPLLFKGER